MCNCTMYFAAYFQNMDMEWNGVDRGISRLADVGQEWIDLASGGWRTVLDIIYGGSPIIFPTFRPPATYFDNPIIPPT